MTLEQMDPRLVEIVPELAVFSPPAGTFDKSFYSVFSSRALGAWLSSLNIDTLIFSGVETDICVLISVLNAVDRGYRVIVATDAICSSSDKFHEELRALYECRFSEQVETALVEEILHRWE